MIAERASLALVYAGLFVMISRPAPASAIREEPITAKELASSLGVEARKIVFAFDSPIYARAELFVRLEEDAAANRPARQVAIATAQPEREISFCFTQRDVGEGTKKSRVLTFQIGGQSGSYDYPLDLQDTVSARLHEVQPEVTAPAAINAETPVYVLLHWYPGTEGVDARMPPAKIASKIKRGYYMVLYFSQTAF